MAEKITITQEGSNNGGNSALVDEILQSVQDSSLLSIPTQPAMYSNVAYSNEINSSNLSHQNALANQQDMNGVGLSVIGKSVSKVSNLGPLEARSAVDVLTNNEVAQSIVDLNGALSAFNDSTRERVLHGKVYADSNDFALVFKGHINVDIKIVDLKT